MSDLVPTFTIVIPTRDRPRELTACLESLVLLDYPRERFDIVVVDDGSRQSLAEIIATFRARLNLCLLNLPRSEGPSVARNRGAARATGEFLAFTDDDCTPAPDWLRQLAARFQSTPRHLVGGRVINALTENPYSTACHVILDVAYEYYDPRQGRGHFFPTSNFALATDQFREMEGFEETWPLAAAEDREFCYRWLQRGLSMTYAPEAKVYHRHRLTLDSYCRLHFRYGRGAYHYHLLRAGGPGEGGLKPDWRFHWNCVRYPFQNMRKGRAAIVLPLLLLWQVVNAAGYFWQRSHHRTGRTSERRD